MLSRRVRRIPMRIQTIVHSRYLRVPAPLATYYVQLLPHSFSVHSCDKYPMRYNDRREFLKGTSFLRGASPLASFEFAFPHVLAATREIHQARSLLGTHLQLFITFAPAIHCFSLVRACHCYAFGSSVFV